MPFMGSINAAGTTISEGQQSGNIPYGGGIDWGNVYGAIGGGAEVIGDVWCLTNPRRPGCPGDPNKAPGTVINQVSTGMPTWIYLVLGLLFIGITVLIVKK